MIQQGFPVGPATLLADAVLALLIASVFAYVGQIVHRRRVGHPDGRRAMLRFAIWWYALAVYTGVGALRSLFGAVDIVDIALHSALNQFTALPLVALLWGLVSYLAYIYTGNPRAFTVVTAIHVAIFAYYAYLVATLAPVAVHIEAWTVPIEYATPVTQATTTIILVTMLAPTLISAVAYGSLFFRSDDRDARFRIGMTAAGFIGWFGSAAIASAIGLNDWAWWPLVARFIGLAATLVVLAAHQPPRWLQIRFDVRPPALDEGPRPTPSSPHFDSMGHQAL